MIKDEFVTLKPGDFIRSANTHFPVRRIKQISDITFELEGGMAATNPDAWHRVPKPRKAKRAK